MTSNGIISSQDSIDIEQLFAEITLAPDSCDGCVLGTQEDYLIDGQAQHEEE